MDFDGAITSRGAISSSLLTSSFAHITTGNITSSGFLSLLAPDGGGGIPGGLKTSGDINAHVMEFGDTEGDGSGVKYTLNDHDDKKGHVFEGWITGSTISMSGQFSSLADYTSSLGHTHIEGVLSSSTISASGLLTSDGVSSSNAYFDGAITASGDISSSTIISAEHFISTDDIAVADSIVHYGDTDTYINFGTDYIKLTAGGTDMITISEGTAGGDTVIFSGQTSFASITASHRISSSGDIEVKTISASSQIIMKDGGLIGDTDDAFSAGNDDNIKFDQTNRRIDTIIDGGEILSVNNGWVGVNTTNETVAAFTVDGRISASSNIFTDGYISSSKDQSSSFAHITTDGNITGSVISASGDTHHFGGVMKLQATDPRFKLIANGANHPGVEWYEDSTRKWIAFNDPDANDNFTIKNDSTDFLTLSQIGSLALSADVTSSFHAINTDGGAITASIISASGIVHGKFKSTDTNTDAEHYSMLQTGESEVAYVSNGFSFNPSTDIMTIGGGTKLAQHRVETTAITASGEISASLAISSSAITADTGSIGWNNSKTTYGLHNVNFGSHHATSSIVNAGDGYGDIVQFGSQHASVNSGSIVYYTGGIWRTADKDTELNMSNMWAVAMDSGALDAGGGRFLLRGIVMTSGSINENIGEGVPLYVADDGALTNTPSTTGGDFNRVAGYMVATGSTVNSNTGQAIIYFNPSSVWVEVS